jgi:hypothetical protein
MAMRDVQRQLDGCDGSQQAAIWIGWTGDASIPRDLSRPAWRAATGRKRLGNNW